MKQWVLAALLCAALAGCGSESAPPRGGATAEEHPLTVGNISELRGTDYLVANVIGGEDEASSFSKSRSDVPVRNLLLIGKDGGATHSLLPDNKGVVERAYFAAAKPELLLTPYDDYTQPAAEDGKPVAPAYFVIEGRAAPEKALSVRAGAMADLRSAVVLEGLDEVLGRWMIDDHRLAVIAVQKARTRYYEIDMKARALTGSHDIALGE